MSDWRFAPDEGLTEAQKTLREALRVQFEAGRILVSARHDRTSGRLILDLENGISLMIPTRLLQGLEHATPEQIESFRVMPGGLAINWDDLDTGFEVEGLLNGIFGNRNWMERLRENARKAGQTKSTAKAAAARENGKKGGRPKKAAL